MGIPNETGGPGKRTVLLAERDETMQCFLVAVLQFGGHEVLVVADDQRLDDLAHPHHADVLLIRYRSTATDESPESGLEVIRRVRRQYPDWPIIAFSASGMKDTEQKLISHGATHFLPMPFAPDALLSLIQRL